MNTNPPPMHDVTFAYCGNPAAITWGAGLGHVAIVVEVGPGGAASGAAIPGMGRFQSVEGVKIQNLNGESMEETNAMDSLES